MPWTNKSYRIIGLYKVHKQYLLTFLYTSNYQVAFEFKNLLSYILTSPNIQYLSINIERYTKELYEDNHKTDKNASKNN